MLGCCKWPVRITILCMQQLQYCNFISKIQNTHDYLQISLLNITYNKTTVGL